MKNCDVSQSKYKKHRPGVKPSPKKHGCLLGRMRVALFLLFTRSVLHRGGLTATAQEDSHGTRGWLRPPTQNASCTPPTAQTPSERWQPLSHGGEKSGMGQIAVTRFSRECSCHSIFLVAAQETEVPARSLTATAPRLRN